MANTSIPFWKGTNFWIAAILFIGSFFGLGESVAQQVVMAVIGMIAAVGAVRQFVLSAKFGGFLETIKQPNTLNYLIQALGLAGIPAASELVPGLSGVVEALVQKNWGLFISRLITLATILFYLIKGKTPATTA